MIARLAVAAPLLVLMAVCLWTMGVAADGPSGKQLYQGNCQRCHAADGHGAKGPQIVPFKWSYEKALDIIRHPECEMPAFSESDLSDDQVAQIVVYLKTLK